MDEDKTLETTSGDDWDGMDFSDLEDVDAGEEEGETTEQSAEQTLGTHAETDGGSKDADGGEVNQQTQPKAEDGDGDTAEHTEQGEGDQTFTLKYMDEVKTVTKDEAVVLAQKGMDYDRVKQKQTDAQTALDSANNKLAYFEQLASSQNMTLDQLIDDVMATQLSVREGIDKTVALGRVQVDRERKALEAEKSRLSQADTDKAEAQKRQQKDIDEFSKEYPDVFAKLATDKDAIPKQVWDDVSRGMTLVSAYSKHEKAALKAENERLKAEAEKLKQKQINKSRSTGSQATKGEDSGRDFADMWWDEN